MSDEKNDIEAMQIHLSMGYYGTKTLTINNVDHCHYEIQEDVLYMKIIPNQLSGIAFSDGNYNAYENFLVERICLLEKVKIKKLAYLNI